MTNPLILALDQGTTSSRSVVIDAATRVVASAQKEFTQHYPRDGWVEHDPNDIWESIRETAIDALMQAESKADGRVEAIGITNQRETVLIWNRKTGEPVANALVWQDRRTADMCARLKTDRHEALVTERTGLLLDPYFSATKVAWILDNIAGAREQAQRGELAFGTVDCFLIWKLTGGGEHVTDETNASRTMLFNIHTGAWDPDLLKLFNIPAEVLPDVKISSDTFGETQPELFGRSIPICGVAGDQQSAAFGQGCVSPGMTKVTYGTGSFVLVNTGDTALPSHNRLLTTRACRASGPPQFALEGSIFIAGAVVQWLRDEMKVLATSAESEAIARELGSNQGVYLVPAFTGLGAPHWDAQARGAIYGLTRQSGREAITRAALESVAYQTHDLFVALAADGMAPSIVRVDGGMSLNNWLVQFVSDVTQKQLERPKNVETTALGAAFLAGLKAGIWPDLDGLKAQVEDDASFTPDMESEERNGLLKEWDIAVKTTRYRAALQAEAGQSA